MYIPLVDCHATRNRSMREIGHLHHVRLFVFALHLSIYDVWLQSFPEIHCTHYCVAYGEDNRDDGENRERCQRFSDGSVVCPVRCTMIHANQLEYEVSQSCKIQGLVHALALVPNSMTLRILTMIATMPTVLSLRVTYPANKRITIVTGMAAIVKANSTSLVLTTMTTN